MRAKPQVQVVEYEDRRQAPRLAIDGRYTVRLDPCDGRDVIICPLLEFSVIGLRLELPDDVALPSDVQILIGNLSHSARIVWRKGTIIGVDLVDEHHDINY